MHYGAQWLPLLLLEDLANRRIRRERNFRDQQDPLANSDEWLMSLLPTPTSCPLGSMCGIGPSVREEHLQKPRSASPASSAHNTWVSGNWHIPEGIG